jgi:hypothetical protein
MTTFFRGIMETIPSLFRKNFSEKNSVANPSVQLSAGHLDYSKWQSLLSVFLFAKVPYTTSSMYYTCFSELRSEHIFKISLTSANIAGGVELLRQLLLLLHNPHHHWVWRFCGSATGQSSPVQAWLCYLQVLKVGELLLL